MLDRLATQWQQRISNLSTRARLLAVGILIVTAIVVMSVLGNIGAAPQKDSGLKDSGLAACTALSSTRRLASADNQEIRAEFAGSRWPDLRAAGTAYVDVITRLHANRYAYGDEIVWFTERLATACARHGRPLIYSSPEAGTR